MPDRKPDDLKLFLKALSRWDNEGGAIACRSQEGLISNDAQVETPQLTNTDLVQLRIRVIALENLVIALLAGASDQQISLTREMADYISPRPGFTHHPLTIHAATQMNNLVDRSGHFRDAAPSSAPSTSSPDDSLRTMEAKASKFIADEMHEARKASDDRIEGSIPDAL